jgi:hypothetical protein
MKPHTLTSGDDENSRGVRELPDLPMTAKKENSFMKMAPQINVEDASPVQH